MAKIAISNMAKKTESARNLCPSVLAFHIFSMGK